jgi:hypothetical protein
MREMNKISESLFEKIRDRFEDVSLGDENAKATQNPEDARFFNFDYVVDGKNHGNITISLIDEISLKIYFSKNISQELEGEDRQKWYAFLKELREFAKRNILSFEPRDITRSTLKHRDVQQQSKADSTYNKDEVIGEGRMYGTHKSSYEKDGNVKLIVRHSESVNPEQRGARSRKIKAIFVETGEGERIKLPHNNLRYARAMARHVSEGGQLTDDFGQHITRIAEECSKLRPFKHSVIRRTFEDAETQAMVEAAFEYHSLLNNTLKRMGGRKGYAACKESFIQDEPLMDDFDVDSLRERFVKRTYNDKMEDALPIVQKAYEMKKSNKFAEQFESWANNVAEDWDENSSDIDVDDLADLFAEEMPIGVDAINAINAISGVITNDTLENTLTQAAQQNPEADARDVIIGWLFDNEPNVYQELMNQIGDADTADEYSEGNTYGASGMDEPNVNESEYDEDQIESIQSAIIRRILGNVGQHSELIKRAGPDGIMNAARDVASFHAPVEELGSSDISIMVREVYQEAGVEYPETNEEYTPREEKPLTYKKEAPSKKRQNAKYYDYLARTLGEGRMKEVDMDLKDLSDEEFQTKYKMSKDDMKAKLAEAVGDDYVNKKEKLAKAMAHRAPKKPEQSILDKVKDIGKGAKAWVQGKDDSMYESDDNLAEMRRLAGLK